MSFDAAAHREGSLEGWEAAAPGWRRNQATIRESATAVSRWMIDALAPQPGQRLLELAAGMGDTALLAAELVAPAGSVLVSDQAEEMLAGARERAAELGIENVEFKALNAEWLDLPLASVDGVLCRWGFMLMADAGAALAETRRVLRPGGRVALAVWDELERNPWAAIPGALLRERGLGGANPGAPGPFSLADPERVRALLHDAGFAEVVLDAVELTRRHESFAVLWEFALDTSPSFHDAVLSRPQAEIDAIQAALRERMEAFTDARGAIELPGRTLVASAEA